MRQSQVYSYTQTYVVLYCTSGRLAQSIYLRVPKPHQFSVSVIVCMIYFTTDRLVWLVLVIHNVTHVINRLV